MNITKRAFNDQLDRQPDGTFAGLAVVAQEFGPHDRFAEFAGWHQTANGLTLAVVPFAANIAGQPEWEVRDASAPTLRVGELIQVQFLPGRGEG